MISRHARCVARPVPPPCLATIKEGAVKDRYKSPRAVSYAGSVTFATSCPVAMNIAVIAFADCSALLVDPDRKELILETP